ncbi:MAG: Rieske (2Fe-2S) protein [bacterium]|nr:Rieske (2Fe-2S) protein [bacterium]
MPRLVTLARVEDVPKDDSIGVDVEGATIALFNVGGRFYATSNACPHEGGPLCDGWTDDGETVTCPWHGWQFPLEVAEDAPDDGVERYRTIVEDGVIKVELPD